MPDRPKIEAESFDPHSYPIEPRWFERPAGIHGLSHTRRVLIHGCAIAASVGLEANAFEALALAAAWHDIGRTHEGRDPEHGAKSVAKISRLGLAADVDPCVLAQVLFAVGLHSTRDEIDIQWADTMADGESMLRVLWVLKDADGLDRVRIAELDPSRLRYPISRGHIDRAWELLAQLP